MRASESSTLLPDVLLLAYRNGFFPMSEPDTERIMWHRPEQRAIIPLDRVRVPRSLRREIKKETFRITVDTTFDVVIHKCSDREDTWISEEIIEAYIELHGLGYAHSVEAWLDDELVGGLYGVSIGGAFFGESMFSTVSNASKVAFANLAYRLNTRGFRLLDTQYINDFTASLGAVEIPDSVYQMLLSDAIKAECAFTDTEDGLE